MTTEPAVLVDVDGVLNAFFDCDFTRGRAREGLPPCDCHPGWTRLMAEPVEGAHFMLTLNPAHGPRLLELAETGGAELLWASTWQDKANTWVSPTVGLPDLPHVPIPPQFRDKWSDGEWKARHVAAWAKGRPFVWFEDELDVAAALADEDGLGEHLVIEVDQRVGLTLEHLAEAAAWLGRPRS